MPATTKSGPATWWQIVLRQLWLPIAVIVLTFVITAFSTSFYFPSATTVLSRTLDVWVWGGIITDLVPSFVRLTIGFIAAVVIGILVGIVLGVVRPLETALRPLTDAARAIPGIALLPIFMMFFGTGDAMKIGMIIFISMWPVILNTIDGVRAIEPTLFKVIGVFRISTWHRFRFVYLPAALPQVFAGARIGLAIAVAVMVAVEMFGAPGGIGYFIRSSQQTFKIVDMWTGMVVLDIFGYVLNVGFQLLEKWVLRWHHGMLQHIQGGGK
ncbi:MAG: ABC transporter permease [Pseudoclavibacter sp.]